METHFLYGSSWTHPVQNAVHSESSVMNHCHANVVMHILDSVPSEVCEVIASNTVASEKNSTLRVRKWAIWTVALEVGSY